MPVVKGNNPQIRAWAWYDWANSSYQLVIASAVFPIYYQSAVAPNLNLGGILVNSVALRSFSIALAFLLIVLLAPALGSLADATGRKRRALMIAGYAGAAFCGALVFFAPGAVWLGLSLFVGATFAFAMSDNFYNSLLPAVTTPDQYNRLSARGYSLGFLGSTLLMVVILAGILGYEVLGVSEAQATRAGFVLTGVWWAFFGWRSFRRLPEPSPDPRLAGLGSRRALLQGYQELRLSQQQVWRSPVLLRFLVAYLVYNMAVQTVMHMAADFGSRELHLRDVDLIITILLVQLVAIPGAIGMARLADRWGAVPTLMVSMMAWVLAVMYAFVTRSATEFYALGAVVGLLMGGTQSLSRAAYSGLLPVDAPNAGALFGFYSAVDKLGTVLGMLGFALAVQATGSLKTSVLFLAPAFVVGMLLLLRLRLHLRAVTQPQV